VTDNLQTDTPHNGHTNILSMILFPQIIWLALFSLSF
jgi:hypothetical protein